MTLRCARYARYSSDQHKGRRPSRTSSGSAASAQRGIFEILVAEALDRMSRDQADVATLYKHLRFAGVMIVTLAKGEISELHVGLKRTQWH